MRGQVQGYGLSGGLVTRLSTARDPARELTPLTGAGGPPYDGSPHTQLLTYIHIHPPIHPSTCIHLSHTPPLQRACAALPLKMTTPPSDTVRPCRASSISIMDPCARLGGRSAPPSPACAATRLLSTPFAEGPPWWCSHRFLLAARVCSGVPQLASWRCAVARLTGVARGCPVCPLEQQYLQPYPTAAHGKHCGLACGGVHALHQVSEKVSSGVL